MADCDMLANIGSVLPLTGAAGSNSDGCCILGLEVVLQ